MDRDRFHACQESNRRLNPYIMYELLNYLLCRLCDVVCVFSGPPPLGTRTQRVGVLSEEQNYKHVQTVWDT